MCGNNELDEVCLWGPTKVYEVASGRIIESNWTNEDFGLPTCDVAEMRVKSSEQSAKVIRQILAGEESAAANIVIANTAAALLASEKRSTLKDAVAQVRMTLSDGIASSKLDDLIEWTTNVK